MVKIQEFIGHTQAVYALCYDASTSTVYSGSGDGMIVSWKLEQQDGILKARIESSVYCLQVFKDKLLAGSRNGILYVFELSGFELNHQIVISGASIFDILQVDNAILVASKDGFVRCYDKAFSLVWATQISSQSVRCLTYFNDFIWAGTTDGTIVQMDTNGNVITDTPIHNGTVFTLAFDPISGILFSGGKDAQIKMFANGGEIQSVPAHLLHVHRLCINSEKGWMLSSSMDKTIKLWETKGLRLLKVIDFERNGGHTSSVNKILWIDKNTLISCSDDRTLKCFEIRET